MSDDSSGDSAAYTFTGLTPGSYVDIAATWPALGSYADYSIIDGGEVIATVEVNQSQSPVNPSDPSSIWQDLGIVST